jgi:hypothetical protein
MVALRAPFHARQGISGGAPCEHRVEQHPPISIWGRLRMQLDRLVRCTLSTFNAASAGTGNIPDRGPWQDEASTSVRVMFAMAGLAPAQIHPRILVSAVSRTSKTNGRHIRPVYARVLHAMCVDRSLALLQRAALDGAGYQQDGTGRHCLDHRLHHPCHLHQTMDSGQPSRLGS